MRAAVMGAPGRGPNRAVRREHKSCGLQLRQVERHRRRGSADNQSTVINKSRLPWRLWKDFCNRRVVRAPVQCVLNLRRTEWVSAVSSSVSLTEFESFGIVSLRAKGAAAVALFRHSCCRAKPQMCPDISSLCAERIL